MTIRRAAVLAAAAMTTVALAATAAPAEAASPIQITRVYVNSPGPDTGTNTSLNAEYVSIKNTSTTNRSLAGYTLRDQSRHVYTFGTFTLGAGKTVIVHTGKGTNTSANRYWNKSWYVWNNSGGDSATLRTASGAYVDKCGWGTVSSYVNC
jgi:predicted extracellular nuclease